MRHFKQVLKSSPCQVDDLEGLASAVEVMVDCSLSCQACADACLGEEQVGMLRACIRRLMCCSGICAETAAVLSRPGGGERGFVEALLEACQTSCRSCAAECEAHADMHEHCRACAKACRECEETCQEVMDQLGAVVSTA